MAKAALRSGLEGADRGIFGLGTAQRDELDALVRAVEACAPEGFAPTAALAGLVAGDWRLLYTTVTIRGRSRTKLGLRSLVTLGEFVQRIDVDNGRADNVVDFSVTGMAALGGRLTVKAAYTVESEKRVAIEFLGSELVPEQLAALFEKNYDLLLKIFNPEGWLDITYVDDDLRVGRDDKGNVYVLERLP